MNRSSSRCRPTKLLARAWPSRSAMVRAIAALRVWRWSFLSSSNDVDAASKAAAPRTRAVLGAAGCAGAVRSESELRVVRSCRVTVVFAVPVFCAQTL